MPTPLMPDLDRARWQDIAKACEEVLTWTAGKSEQEYLADIQLCAATAMNLLIIGEAARRLSEEAKQSFQDVPWAAVIALRNRIAHGYASIDHQRVWVIVTTELPALAASARSALAQG